MQDPVIHHNYSPYSAFDNNPVFWSDPSGADSWSTTMAEWVSAVEAEWAAVDSGADALKVLGSFSKDKGKGGGKVKKTKTVDGFALINYTAGKNYNYIAVISNFGNDGAAMLDYYAAYAAGIPIMLVDDVDGFDKGIDKLDLDGTIVNNYVINSHGGPGSFDIGSTDINMNSITNEEGSILKSVAKTGCIVTAEEHNILGGLGESVSRVLALNNPIPQEFVAVQDSFGESGTPDQLMEKYKLNSEAIVEKVEKVIKRK